MFLFNKQKELTSQITCYREGLLSVDSLHFEGVTSHLGVYGGWRGHGTQDLKHFTNKLHVPPAPDLFSSFTF